MSYYFLDLERESALLTGARAYVREEVGVKANDSDVEHLCALVRTLEFMVIGFLDPERESSQVYRAIAKEALQKGNEILDETRLQWVSEKMRELHAHHFDMDRRAYESASKKLYSMLAEEEKKAFGRAGRVYGIR